MRVKRAGIAARLRWRPTGLVRFHVENDRTCKTQAAPMRKKASLLLTVLACTLCHLAQDAGTRSTGAARFLTLAGLDVRLRASCQWVTLRHAALVHWLYQLSNSIQHD
jgi:hypothetical protein